MVLIISFSKLTLWHWALNGKSSEKSKWAAQTKTNETKWWFGRQLCSQAGGAFSWKLNSIENIQSLDA